MNNYRNYLFWQSSLAVKSQFQLIVLYFIRKLSGYSRKCWFEKLIINKNLSKHKAELTLHKVNVSVGAEAMIINSNRQVAACVFDSIFQLSN